MPIDVTLNFFATFCFKETQSQLSVRSNRLICIQLFRSHFTACVAVVVWKPHISKEEGGGNSFQLDPSMRVFNFLQLVWKMFYESRGCRNFPSPRGACTPSNEHMNPPPPLTPNTHIGVGRFFNWQQQERKQRLLTVWRRVCYSSMARVCFSLRVWSLVWAEVRLAAHTTGTPAHVAPITPNH